MVANPEHIAPSVVLASPPVNGENAELSPRDKYINRDLSLLEFSRRVLEEAQDPSNKLLERLKFASIVSMLADEFFMIRVSGLKERLGYETGGEIDDESTPELLADIRHRVEEITADQLSCLKEDILPALAREGIAVLKFADLSDIERRYVNEYFESCVYPVLTPQAVDPTHPFPYISGGSINIALFAKPTLTHRVAKKLGNHNEFFVRIKIPAAVPRLMPVEEGGTRFILAEDLIVANIRRLIPEASPADCHPFRITRDADIDLRESETEDLLHSMEEVLKLRRFGQVVRLEVCESTPAEMTDYLRNSLEIDDDDIYRLNGPINANALMALAKIDRPDLKDEELHVRLPERFRGATSTFDVIREGDVMLHHPYMPYSIVTGLIKEAVADPEVLAIKMCLYRIGSNSPIAPLLIEAAENGKQVTVVIEIKARFDEEANIEWAKKFEEAGVHVVYGLLGLKTHCKTTLIIRNEEGGLRRYVHLATGNYNPATSTMYTDLGLLTCNDEIGADATELFNYLTVYSQRDDFKHLLVAPICLREKMVDLIRREMANAERGLPSRIIAKMNRLADKEITDALYEASQAGVKIDLIVRGLCTLRPGVPGLSENIRVLSVVGRLLEHSRIYYFENAGEPEILMGSSDWMPRNLDRRVEVLAPVFDPELRRFITNDILASYLKDNVKARELRENGRYYRVDRKPGTSLHNAQISFQNIPDLVQFHQAD